MLPPMFPKDDLSVPLPNPSPGRISIPSALEVFANIHPFRVSPTPHPPPTPQYTISTCAPPFPLSPYPLPLPLPYVTLALIPLLHLHQPPCYPLRSLPR